MVGAAATRELDEMPHFQRSLTPLHVALDATTCRHCLQTLVMDERSAKDTVARMWFRTSSPKLLNRRIVRASRAERV